MQKNQSLFFPCQMEINFIHFGREEGGASHAFFCCQDDSGFLRVEFSVSSVRNLNGLGVV